MCCYCLHNLSVYSAGVSHHGVSVDVDLLGFGVMFDPPSSDTLTVQVAALFQLLRNLLIDISCKKKKCINAVLSNIFQP